MTHPLFKNSFRISERQLQDGLTKADKHLLIQILHFFQVMMILLKVLMHYRSDLLMNYRLDLLVYYRLNLFINHRLYISSNYRLYFFSDYWLYCLMYYRLDFCLDHWDNFFMYDGLCWLFFHLIDLGKYYFDFWFF